MDAEQGGVGIDGGGILKNCLGVPMVRKVKGLHMGPCVDWTEKLTA